MSRQIVAEQRPLRAVVGASVQAAVGRHQDHAIRRRHAVRDDRLVRKRSTESAPALSSVIGAEQVPRRDTPETVGVGRIERHDIDLALG